MKRGRFHLWNQFRHAGLGLNLAFGLLFYFLFPTASFALIGGCYYVSRGGRDPVPMLVTAGHVSATLWMWFVATWIHRQEDLVDAIPKGDLEGQLFIPKHLSLTTRVGWAAVAAVLVGLTLEAIWLLR